MAGSPKIKLAILNTHPIQYFTPLYKKLAKEVDIDLTVLYCSRWGLDEYVDPQFKTKFKWDIPLLEGYNYKFLKNLWKNEDVNRFFRLINVEVIRELISIRYDVLWLNGHNNITNIMAILISKVLGIKLFMRTDTQLNVERSSIKKVFRKPVMKLFYKLFAGFLYIGTRNKEYYEYLDVSESKLFFVPFTVDNNFFIKKIDSAKQLKSEIKKKYKLGNDSLNVLYASKLLKRKNPMDLLFAFEKIKSKIDQVNLVFVGSGEEEERLKNYVSERKLANVFFLGFLNQTELPEILAVTDVFVLPAINEPWGLIINEAMCAGLPIVSTEVVGAVPDLIKEGINGYSFSVGNIDELSEKLLLILYNEELRISMGNNSRKIISNWNYTECIAGIQKALKAVAN